MGAPRLLRSESLPSQIWRSRPQSGTRAAPQALGVDFISPAFFKEKGHAISAAHGRGFSVAAAARPRSAGAIGVAARPSSANATRTARRLRRSNSSAGNRYSQSDSKEQFYTKPFNTAYKEVALSRNLRKLETLFRATDHDGNEEIDLYEFRKACRMPGTQAAFANLGIQPHQCEKIFVYLDDDQSGFLTISEFITGLTDLVGTDIDGTGMELDIEMLSAAYRSKQKLMQKENPFSKMVATGQLGLTQEMSPMKDQTLKPEAPTKEAPTLSDQERKSCR